MDYAVAALFFVTCGLLIFRMNRPRDIVDLQLGILSVLAIGYYCIPIWFQHLSPLGFIRNIDVFAAVSIHFIFFLSVIMGVFSGRKLISPRIAMGSIQVDEFISRRMPFITASCFALYIWYYFSNDLTSYTASDLDAFFNNRGPLDAIIAGLANIALAFIALSVAYAWKGRQWISLSIYAAMLLVCTVLMIFVGQRLALMTPLIFLIGALGITKQTKRAITLFGISIFALMLVSPVAVFVRESISDRNNADAREAVGSFTYGNNAIQEIFKSVVDRSDLIYVTAQMKRPIDLEAAPGLTYYSSVFLIPIPKAIFPGSKPYPLSTDGNPSGELSIKSWNTIVGGGTGSLTAFGGLVAYREGSWPSLIYNGIATGILFVFLARWLGGGGMLIKVFYLQIFVVLTVKKVPPSFFEALAELAGLLPFLIAILIANWALGVLRPVRSHWVSVENLDRPNV